MALVRRHPACPTDRDLSHRWVHRFSARAATSVSERTLAARALNLWTTGTTERTEQTRGVNFERRWGVKIGRRLTAQAVQLPYHQAIVRPEKRQGFRETGAVPSAAAGVVLEQVAFIHTSRQQRVALKVHHLPVAVGGDAHVTDQHVRK